MIKRLARFKAYTDRARWYSSTAQFILIILYTATSPIQFRLRLKMLALVIIVMIGLIVIGYVDRKIGFIKEEQRFYSYENPMTMEIIEKLNKVLERRDK